MIIIFVLISIVVSIVSLTVGLVVGCVITDRRCKKELNEAYDLIQKVRKIVN